MDSVQEQVEEVLSRWEIVSEAIQLNPELWDQNYPDASFEDIDSVVNTVRQLFKRSRAPASYSAGFDVAKAVAATTLPALSTSLNNLQQQQYQHIKPFVSGLNQLLSASLSVLICSSTAAQELVASALVGELTTYEDQAKECLATLKTEAVEASQIRTEAAIASKLLGKAEKQYNNFTTRLDALSEDLQTLEEQSIEAKDMRGALRDMTTKHAGLVDDINLSQAKVKNLDSRLCELTDGALESMEVIDGLLPGATSAGLAYAFEARAEKLRKPALIWASTFIIAIVAMITKAWGIADDGVALQDLAVRAVAIAPLIWLGWLSAIQYGNTVRLEEDYRFKASTAKAFAGYRDHMEHLKDVDMENAENVLAMLSSKTVEVLSSEPGRLLGKSSDEASPAADLMRRGRLKPKNAETDVG